MSDKVVFIRKTKPRIWARPVHDDDAFWAAKAKAEAERRQRMWMERERFITVERIETPEPEPRTVTVSLSPPVRLIERMVISADPVTKMLHISYPDRDKS
jgi:hypothetical protein